MFDATYVFATPLLGGQASMRMSTLYGRDSVALSDTPTMGALTASENVSESATGFGDLFPTLTPVGTRA
jgi:hypothetical protein